MNIKKILIGASAGALMFGSLAIGAFADTVGPINFESYPLGVINGQDGWTSTGAAGSGCAVYDHAVSASLSTAGFGSQSLRISNAVTSGCFGDMTFAKPLTDAVGEVDSTTGTYSAGTLQRHFEMQFDVASTVPGAQQPGLFVSVSPDRGDGSRMSYVGFSDEPTGIDMIFYDVQGTENPANFVETDLGTYDRSVSHHIKLTFDAVDGPSNDVVKVWIDGVLKHTGTSWENYYRYDGEANAEQSPRIVKTVLFRTGGTAAPATLGNGFLFDNLTTESLNPVLPTVPTITLPANNSVVTSAALTEIDWTASTGSFTPMTYQYQAFSDASYSVLVYQSGWLTTNSIPTLGTPDGVYYVRVRAQDAEGNISSWSNDSGNPYKITVSEVTPTPTPVPLTDMNQCKNGGWTTFNNPTFKNQGQCVSYVQANVHAGKR